MNGPLDSSEHDVTEAVRDVSDNPETRERVFLIYDHPDWHVVPYANGGYVSAPFKLIPLLEWLAEHRRDILKEAGLVPDEST
jgi:hypothetical protein